ncbi:MAG: signal peptidase II [Acidimicrobiales bacterium]
MPDGTGMPVGLPAGSARRGPPPSRLRLRLLTGLVAALVVAGDQVTKSVAAADFRHPVHVIGTINFWLTYNQGAAFSLFRGFTLWIVAIGLVLVCVLLAVSRRMGTRSGSVAIGLVLGGAVGNLADRLFRANGGAVIDWIYTRYWPTFNVADACIVVGAILLILSGWRRSAP